MTNTIFIQDELQAQFQEKGYVILSSILENEEIALLSTLFDQYKNEYSQPFHTSHFSTDVNYKKKVNQTLADVVYPKIEAYFNECRPIFGNFMIKNPDPSNFLQMHADWAYVDEHSHRSISVWIPLVDTHEKNGCLGVIEGSHKIMNIIRGPGIQQNSFVHDREWVKDFGTLLPVKAGDAIVYDHALLHFSPANTSDSIRPALNLSFVPKKVDIIHYCIPEGKNEIEKYSVPDDDFFIKYNNFQTPETGVLIERMPKSVITFIDEKMKNYNKKNKSSRGLFSFFKFRK